MLPMYGDSNGVSVVCEVFKEGFTIAIHGQAGTQVQDSYDIIWHAIHYTTQAL